MSSALTRRDLLKAGAAGAAALGLGRALAAGAAEGKKKIPIGLQLYSVRGECAKDLPGVIAAVAKMGYKGVEFAGYHNRKADEIKKMLDDNGLVCCGTHIGLNTLQGDALKGTLAFHRIIGCKFLIVPGLPKERTESKQAWLETAKIFNEISDRVKEEGFRVGYHNHSAEFRPLDGGETGWDVFFSNTKPEVVMQLDIGNGMGGGADPVAILKKFPGRATTIHVKEHGGPATAVIGEGNAPWKEIFELCETTGGTEWYIVEHERAGQPPMEAVQKCLESLRKMGKA